jgi:Gpi18-like mannosyltransferase
VRRGWAALAAAPVLLDARQIQLEHFVLSETLFTFLMLAGIVLLMWSDKPPLWLMGLSGVVFALATLTRTVGQPLAVLVVLYLIVRRIGWRRIATFAVALIIPIAATWSGTTRPTTPMR